MKEVSAQYEIRKNREAAVARELLANERAYSETQPIFDDLARQIEEKKAAQEQNRRIQAALEEEQKKMRSFELLKDQALVQKDEMERELQELQKLMDQDQTFIELKAPDWFEEEHQRIMHEIGQLERALQLKQVEQELESKKREIEVVLEKRKQVAAAIKQKQRLIDEVESIKKVDGLNRFMIEQKIDETPAITYSINKLEVTREKIHEWQKLSKYNESIASAISYVEQLLEPATIDLAKLKEAALVRVEVYTSAEVDGFLEKLRELLKSTQRTDSAVLSKALTGLYKRQNNLWRRGAKLKSSEVYIEESKRTFQQLKNALAAELLKQQEQYAAVDRKWLAELEEQQQVLAPLEQQFKQMPNAAYLPDNIEAAIRERKAELDELQKEKALVDKTKQLLEERKQEVALETAAMEKNEAHLTEIIAEITQLQIAVAAKNQEIEALKAILVSNPEQLYEEMAKKIASLSFEKESLKQEKKNLPLLQTVQKKWLDLLEGANDHDLDEIRKLYIKHANVIGTTCVASARKDFIDNYPVFDVVIIDEVSKATPPELLLPMLKGKKIILVGDHHQLPPLLGNDTLEETLEEMIKENSGFEEKRELEKLLEESLFERLYKNLPEANKTMLAIQYRMHEDIMETITPFYRLENKQLQCGLQDSDRERDHLLESKTVSRSNHLMWLDLPNEAAYFEERMSGGKSLYNPSELQEISALLIEMNEGTAEAKFAGRLPADYQKSVGVISFYGEQVKRLQRMIDQELRLPHLTIRTGTVDRFQGSEMEIILLSMVRNNHNPHGDIGFAKDYRRLNVALSRAKQLLVLVGSSDMFTKRAKKNETKQMYKHVLETVKKKNGLKTLESSRG